jgi:hypothetical protein
MEIITVKSKEDLKKFIEFPFLLYTNDPNWVPPLIDDLYKFFDKQKNPYFEHSEAALFIVVNKTNVLGRITAHTNRNHNDYHNDKKGFFGFFECIDDQHVADMLFHEAIAWLRGKDIEVISGPYNFSTNDECGLLVDGFETSPFVMMNHNLPYYQKLIENFDLTKAMDLYAWYLDSEGMPEFLEKMSTRVLKNNQISVRSLDKKNLKRDIETVFQIYQKAWEKNWGFVPMSKREFDGLVATLLPIVDPELVFIAECDGVPAGFSVALPNFNVILQKLQGRINLFSLFKVLYYRRRLKSLRVITMGVVSEFQGKGIDTLFYYYTWKNGMKKGYHIGEFSWVLETNTMMNKIAKHLGATIHKTYRIYEKSLV